MKTKEEILNKSDIRSAVRNRYGKIAEEFDSAVSCCGPAEIRCGCAASDGNAEMSLVSQLYETPDVKTLPMDVTGLSLGCGDPVTLATLTPGQTVLDLGSGGGIDCFLAAKQVGDTGRVIGVDMTPTMIEKARANQAKLGAENVEFRLGEIEHLPVEDGSVDVIISNCVINLSTEKPQVFREAFRVLKAGGRLAVSDTVTGGPLPQEIKNDLSAWAGCVAGAIEYTEYIAAIEEAGFVDVELTPTYFDQSVLEEAAKQLGVDLVVDSGNGSHLLARDAEAGTVKEMDLGDLMDLDLRTLQQAVFSAKVTAIKPTSE